MCCQKYFSVNWTCNLGFVPILILFQLVILSNAAIPGVIGNTETSEGNTDSGRSRLPQGRETLTTIRSSTVVVPANFTVHTSSSTTRLTVAGVNNPLKSRLKKPGVILSLSLRSKDPKQIAGTLSRTTSPNPTLSAPSRDELMTSTISDLTQASFGETMNSSRKSYRILDRLKNLTNLKMKAGSGSHYGMKKYDSAEEVPAPTTTQPPARNDSTRVGGHLTHHQNKTLLKPPMNVQVHNHGTEYTQPKITSTTPESEVETIEQVETRFVTAEQVGGNRPTKIPFHFTTTTPPPSTTTKPLPPRLNRYTKPYSPHNHIYAPTQNPISVAHNEDDLTVEDFRDFRAAHSAFGSRVNSGGAAGVAGNRQQSHKENLPPPPAVKPPIRTTPSPPAYRAPPPRPPPPANSPVVLKEGKLSKLPKPKPVQLHPQSASSGVKNSHVKLKKETDQNNDNLPFYKEPGGVFEHKYNDNDNEPNDINSNFRAKGPGVKYAPQGPSAQPQTNYNNHQIGNILPRSNHYQNHNNNPIQPLQPTPQYVTVTQQPVFLAPVPIQPVMHHQPHPGYNPVPQTHYYPAQPQPQPYYPSQAPPVAVQYGHNHGHSPVHHGHAPVPPTHYAPVYQPQPPPQLQPQPVLPTPHRPPPVNPYLRPRPSLPAKKIDKGGDTTYFNAPPSRDDPASDYYYGDPRPPKPKPSKKPVVEEEPEEEEEEEEAEDEPEEVEEKRKPEREEDDRDHRKNKPYRKPNSESRYTPPRRTNNSPSPSRYKDGPDRDYEEDDANGHDHRIPPQEEYFGNDFDRNRDREQSRRPSSNSNNGRRPQQPFDDYDSDPNEHIDDFVRPSGERPRGSEANDRDRGFGDFDHRPSSRGGSDHDQPRPFYPSDQDRRFRPSSPDIRPNFDHPNLEYPQRRPSSERPYSPGRSGSYDDNPTGRSRDLPSFDPIYTRTIKQFDEETRPPKSNRHNNNNYNPSQDEAHEDDGSPKGPDDYANIGEPRRENDDRRGRDRDREQRQEVDDEEEEEPEDRGRGRGQNRNRPQQDEEEEEEPEEEEKPVRTRNNRGKEHEEEDDEEEETQQDPKARKNAPDEDEEEEEEDDKSTNNTPSTSNQEEEKKPPPKKPQQEKSGNLDDDITGIEREFGGYFGDS